LNLLLISWLARPSELTQRDYHERVHGDGKALPWRWHASTSAAGAHLFDCYSLVLITVTR
jgi:hypothetical protein